MNGYRIVMNADAAYWRESYRSWCDGIMFDLFSRGEYYEHKRMALSNWVRCLIEEDRNESTCKR